MNIAIEPNGIERLINVLLLSACWCFIYMGIEGTNEEDPTNLDMIAFVYCHVVTIVVSLYIAYRIIMEK